LLIWSLAVLLFSFVSGFLIQQSIGGRTFFRQSEYHRISSDAVIGSLISHANASNGGKIRPSTCCPHKYNAVAINVAVKLRRRTREALPLML